MGEYDKILSSLIAVLKCEVDALRETIGTLRRSRVNVLGSLLIQAARSPHILFLPSLINQLKQGPAKLIAPDEYNKNSSDASIINADILVSDPIEYVSAENSNRRADYGPSVISDPYILFSVIESADRPGVLILRRADCSVVRRLGGIKYCGWKIIWSPDNSTQDDTSLVAYIKCIAHEIHRR